MKMFWGLIPILIALARAGVDCIVQAGSNGSFATAYHDGTRNRILVGYVGEDGIEADVAYKISVDSMGKATFVKA